jgi:putative ABC transport system permease protein
VPDLSKEVSAILVYTKGEEGDQLTRANFALSIETELNEEGIAMAVNPVQVMEKIMRLFVGNVQLAFLCLTGLIVAVSGIGIFVSIYNSMNERRREIAIMRALGAQRRTVSLMILCETLLLCLGGGVLGLLLGHGLVFIASPIIEARSGLLIDPRAFSPWEAIVLPITLGLAALSGLIPSITAYRTDVAETLAQ